MFATALWVSSRPPSAVAAAPVGQQQQQQSRWCSQLDTSSGGRVAKVLAPVLKVRYCGKLKAALLVIHTQECEQYVQALNL